MKTRKKTIIAAVLVLLGVLAIISSFAIVKKRMESHMDKIKALPREMKRVGLQVDLRTGVKKQVSYTKISGEVKDFSGAAVRGATVNLYSMPEKEPILSKTTAANGSFLFATYQGVNSIIKEYSDANAGMFLVEVENGENYNKAYRSPVFRRGDNIDLGIINIGPYSPFRKRVRSGGTWIEEDATLTEGTFCFPDHQNCKVELRIPSGAIRSDSGRPLKIIVIDTRSNLPAQLPPTSWFTYAVDISPKVEFDPEHPVTIRIENTLGIPKLYSGGGVTLPIGLVKDGSWIDVGTAEVEAGNEWIKGEISELGPICFNLKQLAQEEGIVRLKEIAGGETEWISDIYTTLLLGGLGVNMRDGHLKVYKELDKRVIAGNTDRLCLTYSTRYIKPRFLLSFFCNMEKLKDMWDHATPPEAMGNYSLNFNLNFNNGEGYALIDLEEPLSDCEDLLDIKRDLDIELDDIRLFNVLLKDLRQGNNRVSFSFGIKGRFNYGVGNGLTERALFGSSVPILTRENENLVGDLFRMKMNLPWLNPESHFGYGWSLNKEERLFLSDDGMITRKTGEGEVMIYEPIGANEPWPRLTSTLRNFNNIAADDNGNIYVSSLTGIKKIDPLGNMDDFASVVDIRAMRVCGGYLYISRLGGVIKINLNGSSQDVVIPTAGHNIKGIDLDNSGNLYAIDINIVSGARKILNRSTGAETNIPDIITNPEVLAVNGDGTVFFVANKARLYKVTSSDTAEEIYKSELTKDEIVEILRNIHQREWIDAFNEAIAGVQVIRGHGNRLYLADARKGIVWEIDMTTSAKKIVSADERFNADEGPLTGITYTSHNGGTLFLSATWLTSEDNRESRIFRLRPEHKYYRSIAFGSGTYLEKGNVPAEFIPDNLSTQDKEKIKNTGFCLRDIYGNKAVFNKNGLLVSKIDNNGNMEKYEYKTVFDVKKIKITDITGGVTEITYNPASMVIIYPRGGRKTEMTFDGNGDLISVTGPDEGITNYVYNDHMLESIQGPEGGDNTAISYNENDLVSSITFPTDEVREFTYGLLNNAIDLDVLGDTRVSIPSVWDESLYCVYTTGEGHEYKTLYGPFGSPILNVNPRGVKQLYIYNKKGLPIAAMTAGREDGETEPKRLTNFTLYEDKYNLPTKQIEVGNSPHHILAWDFKYKDQFPEEPVQIEQITKIGPGEMGRVGELIPEGIRGGWLGNLLDNLLGVEISDGYSIHYDWDSKGNLLSYTDPSENTTRFAEYDDRGLFGKKILPNGHEITFNYFGNLWNINLITYAGGPVFTLDYDSRGNLKSILNPTDSKEEWGWDSQNRVKEHWITDTQHTNLEYYEEDGNLDDYGRFKEGLLSKITNTKDGVDIEYKMDYYPTVGLLEKITDFEGHMTDLQYDMDRNPEFIDLPGGEKDEIGFTYNHLDVGQLEEVILYSKSYPVTTNIFDQIKEITHPDYTTQLFGYDSRGLLSSVTFRNYGSIAKKYDDLYRLYEKEDGSGTTRYTYDKRSYLVGIDYPSESSWSYIYDAMGRVTSATNSADYTSTVTNSYTSDAWGNLDSSDQDDVRVDYIYDDHNWLLEEFTIGGRTIGYTRYPNDWIKTIAINGRDIVQLNYHSDTPAESAINPYISEIKSADSPTVVLSYGYDKNWNITGVNDKSYQLDASGNVVSTEEDGKSIVYEYENNRLKKVTKDGVETESYIYSDSGEITEIRRNEVPSSLTWENGQLKALGGFTFVYDDNGNLIEKSDGSSGTTYEWDFNNLLTRVNYPDGWVSYKYDAYGRRIAKETSSGEFFRYIYDGYNLIAILDGDGNPEVIFLHDLLRLDRPFAMVYGENVYYFISDRLGSITEIIDSSSTTIARFDYDSFGNILNEEIQEGYEAVVNKSVYRFMGREYDKETGLYHFRRRDFDPVSLIFISRDQVLAPETLTFKNALNDEVSFDSGYTFCKNNPVKFTDPHGTFVMVIGGAICFEVWIAVATVWILESPVRYDQDVIPLWLAIVRHTTKNLRRWGDTAEDLQRYMDDTVSEINRRHGRVTPTTGPTGPRSDRGKDQYPKGHPNNPNNPYGGPDSYDGPVTPKPGPKDFAEPAPTTNTPTGSSGTPSPSSGGTPGCGGIPR